MANGVICDPDWPAEKVAAVLSYNPQTGLFYWKQQLSNRAPIGSMAGWLENGYFKIALFGHRVYAHRLAWLMQTGKWPKDTVDHIDTNRANNKWKNLREATQAENARNKSKLRTNTTGLKGAYFHRGSQRYMAQIVKGRKQHYLGLFDTAQEAHAAYVVASDKLHGEFGRVA